MTSIQSKYSLIYDGTLDKLVQAVLFATAIIFAASRSLEFQILSVSAGLGWTLFIFLFPVLIKVQSKLIFKLFWRNKLSGQAWSERQGAMIHVEYLLSIVIAVNSLILLTLLTNNLTPEWNVLILVLVLLTPFGLLKLHIQKRWFVFTLELRLLLIISIVYILGHYFESLTLNIALFAGGLLLSVLLVKTSIRVLLTMAVVTGVVIFLNSFDHSLALIFLSGFYLSLLIAPILLRAIPSWLSPFYLAYDFNKWICQEDWTPSDPKIESDLDYLKGNIDLKKKLINHEVRNTFRLVGENATIQLAEQNGKIKLAVGLDAKEVGDGSLSMKSGEKVLLKRELSSLNQGWNEVSLDVGSNDKNLEINLDTNQKNIYFEAPFYIPANKKQKKNIVVIVMDALSQDVMSTYNKEGVDVSHIDQFFNQGAIYNDAYVQGEWTTAAFANMLTAQYSSHHRTTHRFDGFKHRLKPEFKTLPEVFMENGYNTYFYSGSRRVSHRVGYDRGFRRVFCDEYTNMMNHDVTYKAIDVLNDNSGVDNFLMLHYMDTHGPPTFWSSIRDADSNFRTKKVEEVYRKDPKEWEDLYRNQVKEADLGLGILLNYLDQPKYRDNTAVVLTSDHGQLLHYADSIEGDVLSQLEPLLVKRMTNVPLMVHCPWKENMQRGNIDGLLEAGIDLYPSMLDLAEIEYQPQGYGRSYIGTDKSPFSPKDVVVTESIYEGKVQRLIMNSEEDLHYESFNWNDKSPEMIERTWKKTHQRRDKGFYDTEFLKLTDDEGLKNLFNNKIKERNLIGPTDDPRIYYGMDK